MALDVNGYNATFKAFVEFAQAKVEAREKKAVARNDCGEITAATADKAYALTRSADQKSANDVTRTIFRDAVAEIFGGESNIPESVKRAMLLSDYGKGKPLTARRIMAVRAAIDAEGSARARGESEALGKLSGRDLVKASQTWGNELDMAGSFDKIGRAANLYAQTSGVSVSDAIDEVARPNSPLNRLYQIGNSDVCGRGRWVNKFLETPAAFARGLRLMQAIEATAAREIDAMSESRRPAFKEALDAAIRAAGDDEYLLECLADDYLCAKICAGRTPDEAVKKLAVVRANAEALREAVGSDEAMLKAALAYLKGFGTTAIPPAAMKTVVDSARALDLGKIAKLRSADTPKKFTAAIEALHLAVKRVIEESGITEVFGSEIGGEEAAIVKAFATGLIAARIGGSGVSPLEGMKNVLAGNAASTTLALYTVIEGKNYRADGLTESDLSAGALVASELKGDVARLADAIGKLRGEAPVETPEYEGDIFEIDHKTSDGVIHPLMSLAFDHHPELLSSNGH